MTVTNTIPKTEGFEELKKTLPKVPEGDVKKRYCIGCHTEKEWKHIHQALCNEAIEEHIPTECIECSDSKDQSPTRGIYLLTDSEAEELGKHPEIAYINIDADAYGGTYKEDPIEMLQTVRWSNAERHYRNHASGVYLNGTNTDDINRAGYQVKRLEAKADPWGSSFETTMLTDQIDFTYDGTDVDIIVCDTTAWLGHPEFNDNTGVQHPTGYTGGNVLKSGFAASSTTGTCEVLDMVLDAPYYLDPDWFEADPTNRLMTRWDGTTVPVESVARAWWTNSSQRSSSASTWGTLSYLTPYYTRARNNGSNSAYPTDSSYNVHGTECMSQTFGKSLGWAFNANKFYIDNMGSYDVGWEDHLDMQKIFHVNKPTNSTYGNKNPTVSSNSWGFRSSFASSGYYYFRVGTTGSGGVYYSTKPAFMAKIGRYGDAYRCTSEMQDNSITTAGKELIDSGVIYVAASGNSNQKIVEADHPDYDNYFSSSSQSGTALANSTYVYSGFTFQRTTSRRGFPNQIGKYTDTNGDIQYPVISIGALDDQYGTSTDGLSSNNLERKVHYSCMGNSIDCYAPGDGSLAAYGKQNSSSFIRQDSYPGMSPTPYDDGFGGTSSACPTSAGMIGCILQANRTWTWKDVKNWLKTSCGTMPTADFYHGQEPTTANSSLWDDCLSLQGGDSVLIWNSIPTYSIATSANNIDEGQTLVITINTTNVIDTGRVYYRLTGITGSDLSSGALESSLSISNNQASFPITLSNDLTTEGTETLTITFYSDPDRLQQVATKNVTIVDTSTAVTETYAMSISPTTVSEGVSFTTLVDITGVNAGQPYWWKLTGISADDLSSGNLQGVSSNAGDFQNSSFSFSHTVREDSITEGNEIVRITIYKDNAYTEVADYLDVNILDTSKSLKKLIPFKLRGNGYTLKGITVTLK
mgnify:FL=1